MTHGSTAEEAVSNCKDAVGLWLREARTRGDFIPRPALVYSGKMTLRIPASLHRRIAEEAEREGISINQWVMYKLAG
jgi:antitoxin HicB